MNATAYREFLESKVVRIADSGRVVADSEVNPILKPFQRAQVVWAAKRGRAAILNGTGLGKTFMQVEWSRLVTQSKALILAPLAVGAQTVAEARKLGVDVHDLRSDWTPREGLNVANYHALHKIDGDAFDAVALDESSILKSLDGATRSALIEKFARTPYRLCCSATPAPNDIVEIGSHAEFLGIMREIEMRATWFVHDEDSWRLKGHAADDFYRWLASWAMFVSRPSDLGFDDAGYDLPPLSIEAQLVPVPITSKGSLFFAALGGVGDRAAMRRSTLPARVAACVEKVNSTDERWLVVCGLNPESEALSDGIRGAVEVTGSMSDEDKEAAILGFLDGAYRVLVSKSSMVGFGMNFQSCARIAFCGIGDSYEQYYQTIRRCWRFGQTRPVEAWIFLADAEAEILANVKRKEYEAEETSRRIVAAVQAYERANIMGAKVESDEYVESVERGESWTLYRGDCVERARKDVADESVDFSVFSPPFSSLFTYSNSPRDMGNARSDAEFFAHFSFLIPELLRVTKPGRLVAVHVANVAAMLSRDGFIGVKDLRGDVVRAFQACGFIFHGEVTIDKCPQAQAIRTKSKSLLFVQKERDSSWLRPALADYVVVFRKPGENAVPIQNADVTRENWIEWARPVWYGIRESETLQASVAREEKDEKHICPLQLETIERCVRLWSNKGEAVFSPYAGIGSELYVAVKCGRRAVGAELKGAYFGVATTNLRRLDREMSAKMLFPATDPARTS